MTDRTTGTSMYATSNTTIAIETEGQPTGEVYALGVFLPKPLHDELQKIAKAGGHTVTQLVAVAISEFVKDFRELMKAIERGDVSPDPDMHPPGKLLAGKLLDIRQQRRIKRLSIGR